MKSYLKNLAVIGFYTIKGFVVKNIRLIGLVACLGICAGFLFLAQSSVEEKEEPVQVEQVVEKPVKKSSHKIYYVTAKGDRVTNYIQAARTYSKELGSVEEFHHFSDDMSYVSVHFIEPGAGKHGRDVVNVPIEIVWE